jgi:23S rRNA (uracil1939-C5)-methyltransferase
MLRPGESIALAVEKPAAGGRMIARVDGQIVLVSGAIPGERVTARIDRVARHVAHADTVSIDDPSPDRRPPSGDPLCGGCLYSHIAYPRQLTLKGLVIADAFARIARLELPDRVRVAPSPEAGYRMRARLHVRGRRLGFFREGTHELCDPRETRQLLPATGEVLERLGAGLKSLGSNWVREVELSENVEASERVLHLDVTPEADVRALERLTAGEGLTRPPFVTDVLRIGGRPPIKLRRHVLSFFQGNRYLLGDLVAHVIDQVPVESAVLDLYAGAGLFSVALAMSRSANVSAIEGDRFAAADLKANAAASGAAVAAIHQQVEAFLQHLASSGEAAARGMVAVVDPPRTGLAKEALQGLVALRPRRVVYVSCDAATLARDARRLVDAGYAIRGLEAFDMFPNTPHIETVLVLDS